MTRRWARSGYTRALAIDMCDPQVMIRLDIQSTRSLPRVAKWFVHEYGRGFMYEMPRVDVGNRGNVVQVGFPDGHSAVTHLNRRSPRIASTHRRPNPQPEPRFYGLCIMGEEKRRGRSAPFDPQISCSCIEFLAQSGSALSATPWPNTGTYTPTPTEQLICLIC